MKTLLIAAMICIGFAACAAETASPVAGTPHQIAAYKAAMVRTLADLKITVRDVTVRGNALQVSYEDCNEKDSREFVLGAVLTLAAPLAAGSETICVRCFEAKRKLTEISVAPEDMRTVFVAGLREGEEARLQALAAETLKAAGLSQAPVVSVSPVPDMKAVRAAGQTDPPAATKPPTTEAPAPVVLAKSEQQQLADTLLSELGKAKLENIIIAVDDSGGWYVDLENRTYRCDIDALAAGLTIIARVLPAVQLTLTAKRDDVAVSRIGLYLGDYAAAQGELLTSEELARRWTAKSGTLQIARRALAGGNSSRGKVDVALRPDVQYEIGNEADPFESDVFLLANADATVAQGWHANVQSATRLTSDVSSTIDRALLSKTGWLGRDWLATGSVGKFEQGFYGWYGELQWDQQQHRLGLVAASVSDALEFGSDSRRHALGYYEYETGKLGLTARVGYGRFVDSNSNGALLSLQRRFGESVVATEAVRGDDGEEALNFRLSIPLGAEVAGSPSNLRLRTDTAFKTEYMSNLSLQGAYLQKGQDLASFRGELSAPYVDQQTQRMLGQRRHSVAEQWPSSQSFEGTSGLIRIPTADVLPDGTLVVGASYMDSEHSRVLSAVTDAVPVFVGIGLLPNLELVGKLTIFDDVTAFDWNVNTDRSFNAHYRLLEQKRHSPALAVGAQDVTFGTTTSYLGKAQYVVGTWGAKRYRAHLGWGRERLDGLFGGFEYALRSDRRLRAMVDYDTEFLNLGLRGFVGKCLTLDVSLLGLEDLGGAVVFRTELE